MRWQIISSKSQGIRNIPLPCWRFVLDVLHEIILIDVHYLCFRFNLFLTNIFSCFSLRFGPNLVNNVGRMYDYPDELGKVPSDLIWSMINTNVGAVTMMTRMLINDMKNRGKGAIVNISSGSELQPLPYMAVYSASKVKMSAKNQNTQNQFQPQMNLKIQSYFICYFA